MDFLGKTAVITGAASGIGAALARSAAKRGMNLVLADVDLRGLEQTQAELGDTRCIGTKVDVADPDDVERLAVEAYDRFGSVHLLCNNAGIVTRGRQRPVWEYSHADWQWTFDVNLFGVVNGLRGFVPRMLAYGEPGHILNTGSVSGFISGAGSPIYGASKHAVVRVTEALYAALAEQGSQIGVTLLCPGLVNTRIFDTERHRPDRLKTAASAPEDSQEMRSIAEQGADPDSVAELAFAGIQQKQFYVFSSDRFDEAIAQRAESILSRRNPRFDDFASLSKRDAVSGPPE